MYLFFFADMDSDIIQGTTMNLRKFRKATVKKRQLILQKSQLMDKEICKKKRQETYELEDCYRGFFYSLNLRGGR